MGNVIKRSTVKAIVQLVMTSLQLIGIGEWQLHNS